MKVAFIGLGVMGAPMAGHLAKAGHQVAVFNRTKAKADHWAAQHGGQACDSAAQAANDARIVFLCVGDDDDLLAVSDEAAPAMATGAVLVDHTTTSAKAAREVAAKAAAAGLGFVDAPVSGGQAGAENGKLTIMCGGDAAHFTVAEPVMAAYAKAIRHMGPAGAGQLTKMCNQICIAGVVQGLAEAVHFAKRAELDPQEVLAAISQGAAQSWQMENRWPTMARGEFDFGFAVDWMRKDLGIALNEARNNGARLEMTALVDQFYAEVQSLGGRRWDTSSLIARLERPNGA